jgi:hypothetical protein
VTHEAIVALNQAGESGITGPNIFSKKRLCCLEDAARAKMFATNSILLSMFPRSEFGFLSPFSSGWNLLDCTLIKHLSNQPYNQPMKKSVSLASAQEYF